LSHWSRAMSLTPLPPLSHLEYVKSHVAFVLVTLVTLVALVAGWVAGMVHPLRITLEVLLALVAEEVQVYSLLVKPESNSGATLGTGYSQF
jgi:hypothetical protein